MSEEGPKVHQGRMMNQEQYERYKEEMYGKKYQINGETFTLMDGTVVPVWRRTKTPGPNDIPFKEK